jgi:hypothetical protein
MKYIYAVCFLLLVCGCHKENDTPVVLPARTLLVYLGGDNNLDAETYDKLVQIKNGWEDGTDGNIIVYQDTPFKDSPRLMEIDGKSEKGYITIHTYDQENSASPQVLKRVINDVTRLYPAKSYGLIVFSHGSGWLIGNNVKKMEDNTIHIQDGKYTTCDQTDHPHFYLAMTKAKVIPGKKVVTGPAYLVLEDVPIYFPLLPEGFFPLSSGPKSGLLMPTFGEESTKGFYIRDLGYYFTLGEHMDLAIRGGICDHTWKNGLGHSVGTIQIQVKKHNDK